MSISKTQAIAKASSSVSCLYKHGNKQWVYSYKYEDGFRQSIPRSFVEARQARAREIAAEAIKIMGVDADAYVWLLCGSVESIIDQFLKARQ